MLTNMKKQKQQEPQTTKTQLTTRLSLNASTTIDSPLNFRGSRGVESACIPPKCHGSIPRLNVMCGLSLLLVLLLAPRVLILSRFSSFPPSTKPTLQISIRSLAGTPHNELRGQSCYVGKQFTLHLHGQYFRP